MKTMINLTHTKLIVYNNFINNWRDTFSINLTIKIYEGGAGGLRTSMLTVLL